MGFIDIDDKRYWDARDKDLIYSMYSIPCKLPYVLPSDSTLREDGVAL